MLLLNVFQEFHPEQISHHPHEVDGSNYPSEALLDLHCLGTAQPGVQQPLL